jgi:hypothetical protein
MTLKGNLFENDSCSGNSGRSIDEDICFKIKDMKYEAPAPHPRPTPSINTSTPIDPFNHRSFSFKSVKISCKGYLYVSS